MKVITTREELRAEGGLEPGGEGALAARRDAQEPQARRGDGGRHGRQVPLGVDAEALHGLDGVAGFFDQPGAFALGQLDLPHERGVGAIFQQAANQICEQILVTADRRVNAAGLVHLRLAHDLFVERLTHAMKPLKLEAPVAAGHH